MIAPGEELPQLDLGILAQEPGLPGLTSAAGQYLAESAAACLDSQALCSGTLLQVRGVVNAEYSLLWHEVTDQVRRTFNDLPAAVEDGAYAIAILLIQALTGYAVIERSRKGTGIDYWIGPPAEYPFQSRARLEVSGMLRGTAPQVTARMKAKLEQARRSEQTQLPAYVVVVEFSRPVAEVAQR